MKALFTKQQTQTADQFTIRHVGISEPVLMEHAALAVVRCLKERFGNCLSQTQGIVLAGQGNNGADAFAVARILYLEFDLKSKVYFSGEPERLSEGAKKQYAILSHSLKSESFSHLEKQEKPFDDCDWVVDGLFGTGLSRNIEGANKHLIEKLNEREGNVWVVSVDIPSGLCADTGNVLGAAVRASATETFGFLKRGLVTGQAASYVGKLTLSKIQIAREIEGVKPTAFLFEKSDAKALLPKREPSAHKGKFGHVYVWQGNANTEGASVLSAQAAFRIGAALVSLTGEQGAPIRTQISAEIMSQVFSQKLIDSLKPGSAFLVGPGMGLESAQIEALKKTVRLSSALVLDADALTLIGKQPDVFLPQLKKRSQPTVLTPHPKEAARLLGVELTEVQRDRYAALEKLVERYGVTVLLKGKGTLVSSPNGPMFVVSTGNTLLAKGGSGDILAGMIAAFLAQGLSGAEAAILGAYLHGSAAEWLSQQMGTERSSLPSELISALPSGLAQLER